MEIFYYGLKTVIFAAMVRTLVVSDLFRWPAVWLSLIYTAVVAGLSYALLLSQFAEPNYRLWGIWLGVNLAMTFVYFKLLKTFEDSGLFWAILPFAVVVVLNEPNLVPIWKYTFGDALETGRRAIEAVR